MVGYKNKVGGEKKRMYVDKKYADTEEVFTIVLTKKEAMMVVGTELERERLMMDLYVHLKEAVKGE